MTIRGRWAPSPSGQLHVGSARTALAAWLSVRKRDGTFVWRTEDLDPPRTVAGSEQAGLDDLRWLGLDWDEGPDLGGPHAPYNQSRRTEHYEQALTRLFGRGRLFPCSLSRSDLREIASAPESAGQVYPASLRPVHLPDNWIEQLDDQSSIRFIVRDEVTRFVDLVYGPSEQNVAAYCGDFVVRRRDGLFAYQFAVVVDDALMGITEVVRGADLLDSTARQIQLLSSLGADVPRYAHVPLALESGGRKLSKRHQSLMIRSLREAGVHPNVLAGCLAHSLGIIPSPDAICAKDLIDRFDWALVSKAPWVVDDALTQTLLDRSQKYVQSL